MVLDLVYVCVDAEAPQTRARERSLVQLVGAGADATDERPVHVECYERSHVCATANLLQIGGVIMGAENRVGDPLDCAICRGGDGGCCQHTPHEGCSLCINCCYY